MSIALILPCAGQGSRAGTEPKQLQILNKKPVFIHSLLPFVGLVDDIIIVCSDAIRDRVEQHVQACSIRARLVSGGDHRMASVLAGLRAAQHHDYVLIHDAARPNIRRSVIESCIVAMQQRQHAVLTAIPCTDTIKRQDSEQRLSTIDREAIYLAQTPQGFPVAGMIQHYEAACKEAHRYTDDISICEQIGMPIEIILGHRDNLKYTYPEDLDLLRKLMA